MARMGQRCEDRKLVEHTNHLGVGHGLGKVGNTLGGELEQSVGVENDGRVAKEVDEGVCESRESAGDPL